MSHFPKEPPEITWTVDGRTSQHTAGLIDGRDRDSVCVSVRAKEGILVRTLVCEFLYVFGVTVLN